MAEDAAAEADQRGAEGEMRKQKQKANPKRKQRQGGVKQTELDQMTAAFSREKPLSSTS